jgi:predicted metal-dependent hydrolase
MEKKLYDPELGIITLRTNPRAIRYSLRTTNGFLIATMPAKVNEKTLLDYINKNKSKLIEVLKESSSHCTLLSDATEIQTYTFKLHIFRTERTNFYMTLDNGFLHIACPRQTNFEDKQVQQLLKNMLGRALRHEARRVLPVRLKELSLQYGFSYAKVRIANTKSRWGSCSTNQTISLSLSLMLLPGRLIDYVLLHELCHTVEMNHSKRFWDLMNKVTDNQALAIRKELKNYRMPYYLS